MHGYKHTLSYEKIAIGSTHNSDERVVFGRAICPTHPSIIDRLNETRETALECNIRDYIGIFKGLLARVHWRNKQTHSVVLIWGHWRHVFRVLISSILAGLNEEPGRNKDSDPWLNL